MLAPGDLGRPTLIFIGGNNQFQVSIVVLAAAAAAVVIVVAAALVLVVVVRFVLPSACTAKSF